MRVAVIDRSLCKPKHCNRECIRFCPLVRSGAEAIRFDEEAGRPVIAENVCAGCGICVKKCPFGAIRIVNLPEELEESAVHRYGPNAFKLYRLPIPKLGKVVGIIGENGVGKSTALRILAGLTKPNLGDYERPPDWPEIIRHFRGSELQPYFEKLSRGKLRAVMKPQEVDKIPKYVRGRVADVLERVDERGEADKVIEHLALDKVRGRRLSELSGGELQKVAIAAAALRDADVYLFDEPSSYLDVRERLRVAKLITSLASNDRYVIVVEHDLAVLDYVSDLVHIIYGDPGVYGIVSLPRGVRGGINVYLRGYLREENVRIREEAIKFELKPRPPEWRPEDVMASWSRMVKRLDGFTLEVEPGEVHRGEVVGVLGPNGIGKTTFIKLLAGLLEPDEGYVSLRGKLKVSYKPQFLHELRSELTVMELLESSSEADLSSSWFKSSIERPLSLTKLMDRRLSELSGGELQRAAIAACLSREADIYLLDEPMAYLDVEQRLTVARLVKRLTEEREAATFMVEHDIVAQDFTAVTLMVFEGVPGERGYAHRPMGLRKGMNLFLRGVGVTFRRDPETGRPRVNKEGSYLDRYQKEVLHEYYYVPSKG